MRTGKFNGKYGRIFGNNKFLEARQRRRYDILSWDVIFRFQIPQQKMVPNHKT